MTEPGYVPPPPIGWWVKQNMTLFPPNATFTLTGGVPAVLTPNMFLPAAATFALTGETPTISSAVATPRALTGSGAVVGSSIAIPAHNVGDVIVLFAVDGGSTTTPLRPSAGGTVPAWLDIDANTGADLCASRPVYCVATATNHTSGVWSTVSHMAVAVLAGPTPNNPIGGAVEGGGTGTSPTAPAITLAAVNGSSNILCFYMTRGAALNGAPSGYTRRVIEGGFSGICLNTKDVTTSDGAATNTGGSAALGWRAAQIEILR